MKRAFRRLVVLHTIVVGTLLTGCVAHHGIPVEPSAFPFPTDTTRIRMLAPGVVLRYYHVARKRNNDTSVGPWAIYALTVDLRGAGTCYSARAAKGMPGASGRDKTSSILQSLDSTRLVVGGLNADYWDPRSHIDDGTIPRGAFISGGRVIAGPSAYPVLAFGPTGLPTILSVRESGSATSGWLTYNIDGWNRATPGGLALFDPNWGTTTVDDSAAIAVTLRGTNPPRVVRVTTASKGVTIPRDGVVLVAGSGASASLRSDLLALHPGDQFTIDMSLQPVHPREAVGGYPVLLRDSAIVDGRNKMTDRFATQLSPRSAIGIGNHSRRLILVVIDKDMHDSAYSAGIDLASLSHILLAFGATDAINFDGSGSTTLVYSDPDSDGALEIANRPADRALHNLQPVLGPLDTSIGVRGEWVDPPDTASGIGITSPYSRDWSGYLYMLSDDALIDHRLDAIQTALGPAATQGGSPRPVDRRMYVPDDDWATLAAFPTGHPLLYPYSPGFVRPVERRVTNVVGIVRGCRQ